MLKVRERRTHILKVPSRVSSADLNKGAKDYGIEEASRSCPVCEEADASSLDGWGTHIRLPYCKQRFVRRSMRLPGWMRRKPYMHSILQAEKRIKAVAKFRRWRISHDKCRKAITGRNPKNQTVENDASCRRFADRRPRANKSSPRGGLPFARGRQNLPRWHENASHSKNAFDVTRATW